MDIDFIQKHIPQIIYGLVAAGVMYLLIRYRKKNDLTAWLQNLRANAARAVKDEAFRKRELADAEAEIAKYPVPGTVVPIKCNHEAFLQILPKLLFMICFSGVFFTYMGLFPQGDPGKGNWEIYVGPALLLLTGLAVVKLELIRANYGRVQQMNRKYLLQKAGQDPDRHNTMVKILEYYPGVSQLWLEHADQLAASGRMDEALAAIKKAREISPDNMDMMVVELSFLLRADRLADAERSLKALSGLARSDSDPRLELYTAALNLRQNEVRKAEKNLKEALDRDRRFCETILPLDQALVAACALAKKEGLVEDPDAPGQPTVETAVTDVDGGEEDAEETDESGIAADTGDENASHEEEDGLEKA